MLIARAGVGAEARRRGHGRACPTRTCAGARRYRCPRVQHRKTSMPPGRWRRRCGDLPVHHPEPLPGTDSQSIRDIESTRRPMACLFDPRSPLSVLLDPQTYTEMKTSTRAALAARHRHRHPQGRAPRHPSDGRTPAWDAGVRRGDRITCIERDSTDNMALQDAVDRLRGEPGHPSDRHRT